MKLITQLLIILFPWKLRRLILIKLFKFKIHKTARIGKSIILADNLFMGNNSVIGSLTFCKNIGFLKLYKNARLGSLNYITGCPQNNTLHYLQRKNRQCQLTIGAHSAVTSRHFIDCTAGVTFGEFTTFAGIRSQILTHAIDLSKNIQDCKPVEFGSYCFVGSNVTVLAGSTLPDFSVLGAKSLLNKNFTNECFLYGGVPAIKIKELEKEKLAYFNRNKGFVN
tara:strand:- start:1595 stop:2263 length:669 start_codon:yes stop_codon:yes gene_type:complete